MLLFPLLELFRGVLGDAVGGSFGFGSQAAILVVVVEESDGLAHLGPQTGLEGDAHDCDCPDDAELDLDTYDEWEAAVREGGLVLVSKEVIEAEVVNVEFFEADTGEAVDAEDKGAGTGDGSGSKEDGGLYARDAREGKGDGKEDEVENEAKADRFNDTVRAEGLDEETKDEATKAGSEVYCALPKYDAEDASYGAGDEGGEQEETTDGFAGVVDLLFDTGLEDDGDGEEGERVEAESLWGERRSDVVHGVRGRE